VPLVDRPRQSLSPGGALVRLRGDIQSSKEVEMKYALLIYTQPGSYEALSEEARQAASDAYMALAGDPRCAESAQLQPVATATTVRVEDGRTLTTDGPFADTKEVFGGYYVFEAENIDEVIELASSAPAASLGGSVEIRPVVER
jgi:hypothetical protein